MLKICFIGIFIGTSALGLVAAIMNGFEKATHEKLQGIHADIIMHSPGPQLNATRVKKTLEKEFPATFSTIAPIAITYGLAHHKESERPPMVVSIIGIDPREKESQQLLQAIVPGKKSIVQQLEQHQFYIGSGLAKRLELEDQKQFSLLFMPENVENADTISLDQHRATIAGIFTAGIDEYDAHVIFCSLSLFKELFPNLGVSQISLRLINKKMSSQVLEQLKKRFRSLDVFSWKDLYPALVSALTLEKYAMILILALLTLVAGMSIVALLFMYITHKRFDSAILLAMGMPLKSVRLIFITIGMTLAMSATTLGLCAASLASYLLDHYRLISLPDIYYVTHLPSRMDWHIIGGVFLIAFIISLCATILPTRRLRTLSLCALLKHDW